jgi:hypothetical protein
MADTDLQAPLARMWRDVYAKAAGVAEERTRELLKYHVYTYPHGAGGGGGGGGWVLLSEQEVAPPAGVLTLRLPASGSVAATYDTLVLELRARSTYTGTSREYCTLTVNDETPVSYASTITRNDVGTLSGFASGTDNNWDVGPCPKATAPAGVFGAALVQLPMYARTDAFKTHLGHAVASTNTSGGNAYSQFGAGWLYSASTPALAQAAIASVQVRLAWGNLAQGTLARLWGVKDAGGGGGGTADVTITTDASLVATEAPANTFALATRISADTGNALSLHANGLFATGGAGGTGNTTMYTQTTSPTGATNSLWFNPSEAA